MNYRIDINYDGSAYKGFAKQPNGKTIQGEIEKALSKLSLDVEKTTGCGRTDAGVHALRQTVSFKTEKEISTAKLKTGLNAVLPQDIRVLNAQNVDESFNARYSAKGKIYEYRFVFETDAFNYKYATVLPNKFNLKKAKKASKFLIGTHDFKSFSVAKTAVKNFVKTIKKIKFIKTKDGLVIRFVGSGFLHNMVRIIVGTLIDVGTGKIIPEKMKVILNAKNRTSAGKTAPAQGLFLVKAIY